MTSAQTISAPPARRQARRPVSNGALPSLALVVAGLAAIVIALAFDSAALERTLRGQADGTLAWGPTLFRALLALHGLVLLAAAGAIRWHSRDNASECLLRLPPARSTAPEWGLLVGLLIAATLLRLWRLDTGLWLDEILMLADFVRPPTGHILTSFPSQNQHMLYSLLAHGLFAVFGESIWLYRLPAVAFGVASILALFLLARRVAGTREALMASALMTLSYHHVWFSQNARGYSGLLLFATLATWLWIEALPRNQWRWWVAYAVSVALGMWLHLTMAFIPLVHGLTWLALLARSFSPAHRGGAVATEMASRWQPIGALVLSGTITLQLYALSLPEFLRVGLHEESKDSSWTNPLWLIGEIFRGLRSGYAGVAVLVVGAGMIGAMLGLRTIARRNWVSAVSMVLPGLLLGTMIVALRHNLWPRFFFFCAGFAILVAVRGTVEIAQLFSTAVKSLTRLQIAPPRLAMAMWIVVVVSSALTLPRCYGLPKQDFGGARDYVEKQTQRGDVVVTVGLAASAYQRYYAPHWPAPRSSEEFQAVRNAHDHTWLVYTMPIHLQAFEAALWEIVDRDFEVVKTFPGTLGGGEVFVCRERVPRTATTSGVATAP